MTKLRVSPEAAADLETILGFLEQNAGRIVALRFGQRLRTGLRDIHAFPESGASRPALGAGLRLRVVAPYVVFYRIDVADAVVAILRILHGRRAISATLFNRYLVERPERLSMHGAL